MSACPEPKRVQTFLTSSRAGRKRPAAVPAPGRAAAWRPVAPRRARHGDGRKTHSPHRPGRPAATTRPSPCRASASPWPWGLCPQTPGPPRRSAGADHLVGHRKGYQAPRTGSRSYVRQGAPPGPGPGRLVGHGLPDEEIRPAAEGVTELTTHARCSKTVPSGQKCLESQGRASP